MMVKKIQILVGAPERHTLDWNASGLLSEFQNTIVQFTGINPGYRPPPTTSSAPEHAVWRSLSLDKASIPTGFSQQYGTIFYNGLAKPTSDSSEFLDTAALSFASDSDNSDHHPVLSQFYEQSMAAHTALSSSKLISQTTETTCISDRTSFMSSDGSQAGITKAPLLFPGSDHITDLNNIPSAAYILKIQPQTMTCNLIVGVISISQPRAIKTHWGATKHLIEMLVGDDTKAGFAITYWLPSDNVDESPLAGLRTGDVIFVQNVAFNVFTNKVYGSSLRKNLTKVHLLYRMKLDSRDPGGYYSTSDLATAASVHPQLGKTQRVRDWVVNFVGRGTHANMNRRARWNQPPLDDTQL